MADVCYCGHPPDDHESRHRRCDVPRCPCDAYLIDESEYEAQPDSGVVAERP